MVRSGLTPLPDVQHYCVIWLSQYFERFGDSLPDADIVHVSVNAETEVYVRYKKEREAVHQPFVNESAFFKLWRTLFPKHRRRPHCDIPGSCDTCYYISELRQGTHSKEVEQRLHDAHFLHRAGMFMNERGR
jgi:hypothetical protein